MDRGCDGRAPAHWELRGGEVSLNLRRTENDFPLFVTLENVVPKYVWGGREDLNCMALFTRLRYLDLISLHLAGRMD
jgi:hypothetical protein